MRHAIEIETEKIDNDHWIAYLTNRKTGLYLTSRGATEDGALARLFKDLIETAAEEEK